MGFSVGFEAGGGEPLRRLVALDCRASSAAEADW
jgi:hypothetical protein